MNANLDPAERHGQDPSPPTRRVIDVIELLADSFGPPLTLAQICRQLRISRSTGHAILATLAAADWVSRDPLRGTYALGGNFPRPQPTSMPVTRKLREPLARLSAAIDMAVCVSEVRAGHIAVIESAAPDTAPARVTAGQRLPFVAPFGREFVAWASAAARDEWLESAGPVNDVFRVRMPHVLDEIQRRGYGIERLSDPLLRVYSALLALDSGEEPDPVAVRLAGAVADLTIVDFLPGELADVAECSLATISAPIFDARGEVVMTVSAQPYRHLAVDKVRWIGDRVREFAAHAHSLMAGALTAGDR